jgi:hypothetical protein
VFALPHSTDRERSSEKRKVYLGDAKAAALFLGTSDNTILTHLVNEYEVAETGYMVRFLTLKDIEGAPWMNETNETFALKRAADGDAGANFGAGAGVGSGAPTILLTSMEALAAAALTASEGAGTVAAPPQKKAW